ncbi:M13 family metallopeptidase [Aurantiacibacter gangjinensis]|uniref:Zinc metalloprotease n=1 Tax=Aurantiacibacter gangjinensis TaxID=502682 RepID=A0A0G9ML45_9SPHN|nr:M13 family metallopeptidase [Aurantiacibacter gangjinensis]APE27303.1 Peptidase M13 family protein [Aurantiacibacter gangjinensis]KLE31407.1 zinc metalloprotease [Aurantiacibacter gangjinensis]
MIRNILITSVSAIGLAAASPALANEDAHDGHNHGVVHDDIVNDTDSATEAPTMDFGTWGVGLDYLDNTVDPGDDFNAYANGIWTSTNEIPADRQRYGAFDMLREQSVVDVQTLMADLIASDPAEGTAARRIVDAYNAFVDTDAIDASGLAPAYPYLQQIFDAPDLEALVRLMEQPGMPSLVSAGVGIDARNPTDYAVSIGFGGIGLPDRDYYLVDSESNLEIREKYLEYMETMFEAAGYADPAATARAVYAFERDIAELEWARQMFRIPQLTYNVLSRDELEALAGDFPVAALLEAGDFAGEDRFLASQLPPTDEEIEELGLTEEQLGMIGGGLPAMMELLTETPLATLQAHMARNFLASNASVLSTELDAAQFDFYGRTISGAEEQEARWKRGISTVEGMLGEQLGALYVEQYFPPESKAQMDELVANLSRAMSMALDENEWMTADTLAEARTKLEGFVPMIGYPDEFETYDGLEISASDPLANRMATAAWGIADNRARLGTQVDPTEWGMLPQTVNAYYSPLTNRIVFPAAILQPPFFNASADPAVNYGGIGAVIGHEIGHGYDDQGSQFDATGTLRNWWQDSDREGFEAFTQRMGEFIESYCPVDSAEGPVCLRARQSMGETLGDVVGLQMAYRAYQLSLNGEEAPVIDGLTGDQRFFLGYAQIWRGMEREESLRNRVMTANHPPGEFRLNNAVRHTDAWYEAFGVTEGDDLYLAPEDRIRIW